MRDQESPVTLERSRSRWRMLAIGLLGTAAGAVLAGAVMPTAAPTDVAAVVLEPTKSSGRWNSTLLAVMENGDIMYLDTSRPQTKWVPYEYSPSFNKQR